MTSKPMTSNKMTSSKKSSGSQKKPLLIRGGTLLDPSNQRSRPDGILRDLLIADGRVCCHRLPRQARPGR